MRLYSSRHFASIVLALVPAAAGCATQVNDASDDGGGGQGTTAVTVTSASTTSASTSQASTTTGMGCAVNCADVEGPPCTVGVCNMMTGRCDFMPAEDGAPCEDGLFCTDQDECVDGECIGGPLPDCGASEDPCLETICDEDEDECSVAPMPNGSACVAEDLCTSNAICQNGTCLGAPKDCSATPVADCEVGACDPMNGNCVPVIGNIGLPCDDSGDPCMVSKTCDPAGACVGGVPKDCSAFTNGCNNGLCEAGTGICYGDPVPPGGTCLEATDACNLGICDTNGSCIGSPANNGGSCNDGSSCTVSDVCNAGTCAGVPDPNYTIYFSETFASNNQGWTFPYAGTTEWAIGSATAGACGSSSTGNDPGTDHTTSADNGVAGVVLGGCYTSTIHTEDCIVSPVINANPASGSVFLSYYRHLHTDYPNYMTSKVEVSSNGGATWTQIYAVPSGVFQNDAAWTFASFDVTAYKSSNMKVRFCHSANQGGIITGGGWNIDDVTVASSACP